MIQLEMNVAHTLQIAQRHLERDRKILLAIIYGSFAKGTPQPQSDIDLAVASSSPLTDDEKVEISLSLSQVLGREIDVIDLRKATGTVLKEALTTGKILFSKDPILFSAVLKRMLFTEEDFEKNRRRIMKQIRKAAFHAK